MGDVAKVVAIYSAPFWRDHGWSGRAASRVGPLVEVHDLSGPRDEPPALFGFAPRAVLPPGADPATLEAPVLEQLVALFGPPAGEPVALRIQAWWTEPHTLPPDHPNTALQLLGHARLREPLMGGRLHLISTETSGQSPGHLDGALERADTVVNEVLKPG